MRPPLLQVSGWGSQHCTAGGVPTSYSTVSTTFTRYFSSKKIQWVARETELSCSCVSSDHYSNLVGKQGLLFCIHWCRHCMIYIHEQLMNSNLTLVWIRQYNYCPHNIMCTHMVLQPSSRQYMTWAIRGDSHICLSCNYVTLWTCIDQQWVYVNLCLKGFMLWC